MNKRFKPFFVIAILAIFSAVNAQEAEAPAEEAAPVAEVAPAVEAVAPVAASAEILTPKVKAAAKDQSKKKKRGINIPKTEFAMVDFPASFEIQGRKVMPIDTEDWSDDNLNEWWGRANLMVVTESENFQGKVHLRMYPGEFANKVYSEAPDGSSALQVRDRLEIYEAWAWHRGDYFDFKIGRWSNTTRYGSQTYGGYIDAKKNMHWNDLLKTDRRTAGFMSTYSPENAFQLGFHNASEDISLYLSLISMDRQLNKGDLRIQLNYQNIADVAGLDLGLGYRSNVFDEIHSQYGDVTHSMSFGGRVPVLADVGFLKSLNLFFEAGVIGFDDQNGEINGKACDGNNTEIVISSVCRADKGKLNDFDWPLLGGIDIELYRAFDKIVIEAEYDTHRKNLTNEFSPKKDVKDVQGSIYVQKQLNDRFTINLGLQSENNTKDFSFAGRLQGRIN
jgi:hypothetical protein